MENLHQVELALLGLLLLFCRSALLTTQYATFRPSQLEEPVGATVKFTCKLSVTNLQVSISWYKLGDDKQPYKLDIGNRKYNSTKLDAATFEITISDLQKNDSGIYFCSVFWPLVTESNRANLTVTEKELEPGLHREDMEDMEKMEDHGQTLLAVVGGIGLVLVLPFLCYYLFNLIQRRQGEEKLRGENTPLEEDPPAVSVFTVDYGVLKFQGADGAQRVPHEFFASDRTEYATIIFPQEKPVAAEAGRKAKKLKNCPRRTEPR